MKPAPVRPWRPSQSFLAHMDRCPQSARLYRDHASGATSHPKMRGIALHRVWERMLTTMVENGEQTLYAAQPGEDQAAAKRAVASLTETIVHEVRAQSPDLHCTIADWDKVRLMAFHLAVANPVDVSRVVGIERKFVLDVAGYEVSGKLDVASLHGESAEVVDVKTALHVPGQEEFEDSFQHKLYGLLLLFGQPVTKVKCASCEGTGIRDGRLDVDEGCAECGTPGVRGSGEVETRDPCIGGHVAWVRARELYPRYLRDDGTVAERNRTLTRTELNDFRLDLEALVGRVDAADREGAWPAVPGHHCFQCPAPAECPLPEGLRGPRGAEEGVPFDVPTVTAGNVRALAERWLWMSEGAVALRKAIRGFCKTHEVSVRVGRDFELGFAAVSKRSVDRDALQAGAVEAARFGQSFDPDEFVRVSTSTEFRKRRLSAAELRAEVEPEPVDGPDKRWGETAPW